MCSEPTSLVVLMAKAEKYATADSAMRVKVTASDKAVPTPATPKPAGDNQGGQNNYKRKADQTDSRSNSKLVASVEGETSAPQDGPPRKRINRRNTNWLPKQSFEQLLDAPCKIYSRAQPTVGSISYVDCDSHAGYTDCANSNSGTGCIHGASTVGSTNYAGYSSYVGSVGHIDSNGGIGYDNNPGSAWTQIMSSRQLVGGRHGGRR
ncbi:hypothetical protein D1007_24239 [Hordeum vulgare]|nr:hypothetical protein D1007_24239 [Hordeum vulgare]